MTDSDFDFSSGIDSSCRERENKAASIAIFGGTFDPVHRSHLEISTAALRNLSISELILIPTYMPPHKRPLFTYEERCSFLAKALEVFEAENPDLFRHEGQGKKIRIGHYERELYVNFNPEAAYFVSVARLLAAEYPQHEIVMLLGEDAFLNLERWYKVEEILQYCSPAVLPRIGVRAQDETYRFWQAKAVKIHTLPVSLPSFSSLAIRQALLAKKEGRGTAADDDLLTKTIPDSVRVEIERVFFNPDRPCAARNC